MSRHLLILCSAVLLSSCVHAAEKMPLPQAELLDFAKVSCFFWYFSKKGYDLADIRGISGGIVELGSGEVEQYKQVSFLVKNYKPPLKTKQNIDIDLLKCFNIDKDADFLRALAEMR